MHKLKESMMAELREYESKMQRMGDSRLSTQELDRIHKLTDSVKNIDKIHMLENGDGYSGDMYPVASRHDSGEYGSSYRGRMRAKRDSMGRYSREDGYSGDGDPAQNQKIIEKLEDMIESLERS